VCGHDPYGEFKKLTDFRILVSDASRKKIIVDFIREPVFEAVVFPELEGDIVAKRKDVTVLIVVHGLANSHDGGLNFWVRHIRINEDFASDLAFSKKSYLMRGIDLMFNA
jgi:hypothetical protein